MQLFFLKIKKNESSSNNNTPNKNKRVIIKKLEVHTKSMGIICSHLQEILRNEGICGERKFNRLPKLLIILYSRHKGQMPPISKWKFLAGLQLHKCFTISLIATLPPKICLVNAESREFAFQ